jgi:hypothetical protein
MHKGEFLDILSVVVMKNIDNELSMADYHREMCKFRHSATYSHLSRVFKFLESKKIISYKSIGRKKFIHIRDINFFKINVERAKYFN